MLLAGGASAQTLTGKVFGSTAAGKEMMPGAIVRWLTGGGGTAANENGVYNLAASQTPDRRIVISATGYQNDTLDAGTKTYLGITLSQNATALAGVEVRDTRGSYISALSIGQTEVITARELSKAACCDLAGCFGTQASVQPQTTNVVTNAQELRILGLSGVYNQVLFDGQPLLYGSAFTYGISTFPGTLVENIFVAKGTTSVLQGFESISGQINLIPVSPEKADPLYLNAYINSFGEKHLNAQVATPVGKDKKWHTLLSLHTVQPSGRYDRNNDGFLDLPLLTRYAIYNKWSYGNERNRGLWAQIGLRFVNEQRIGGQTGFDAAEHEGSSQIYGQSVRYNQPEAYLKTGWRFNDRQAISLNVSGQGHDQKSWFGTTRYTAGQLLGNLSVQHEVQWAKEHELKWGVSYRYQKLDETIAFASNSLGRTYAGDYATNLSVPGVFAENSWRWKEGKVVLLTGARLDQHQKWGTDFTPRSLFRWDLGKAGVFRASAGTGWRQVSLFSEQAGLLVSSRDIVFAEPLKPEQAANFGISHSYRYTAGRLSGAFTGDFYRTVFSNQFFPEYDVIPNAVVIRNFGGTSRSNGLQLEATGVWNKQLEGRIAYNYLDVYRIQNGETVDLPFNPRNRAMAALSYRTKSEKWQADANMHWFDKMRLPDTRNNPEAFQRPLYSDPYATLNVQGTFRHKALEIYAGCENVFGFVQQNPIISAGNPFGRYFDISSVWGPTRGREFYLGVKWKIKKEAS